MRKILILLALVSILTGCVTMAKEHESYSWTKHRIIAHAAGGIKGKDYTNSEEAFINSYNNGYKLIEVDLSLTSDGKLVARHGWNEPYGQDFNADSKALTYKEFMGLPYYKEYTPMDLNKVLNLLKEHPEVYILLDGKVSSAEDTEELYEKVGEAIEEIDEAIIHRLIPQMYYKEDLDIIRSYGFHDVMYIVGREQYSGKSIAAFCIENDIKAVGLSWIRASETLIEVLSKHGIVSYIYTINDPAEMYSYFEIGVHGFYTDYIMPDEIEDTH
ncbi:hypothetical protein KP78_21470 [Jeotgalibacillus soli]|uniref:GP-PDE domain-containing protein n=2 Tax=Jeotgalibacillus soli TaxID=889306 RepID=A0A0C2VP62_9BACL|nr:hypothetical protein KP78_21470 [Jeotgalibacillus soli]